MGGVLPYKWEAYCSTNGRRIAGFPFLQGVEARKVRRYKWGAYCRTNWRCTAVLSPRPVGVGVSETLPNHSFQNHYTHEITISKLFRGLQLQLSGVCRIDLHYSYTFFQNAVTERIHLRILKNFRQLQS